MADCPPRGELRGYLVQDGSLEPDRMELIEGHVEFCLMCQEILQHLDDEPATPGTTMPFLPGYRVYQFLGSGAFGEVWLAQDLNLPRVVALKTLRPRIGQREQDRALEALRHDAFLMAQIEHPNVVRVHTWLSFNEQHYLVMQFVSGGSRPTSSKATVRSTGSVPAATLPTWARLCSRSMPAGSSTATSSPRTSSGTATKTKPC